MVSLSDGQADLLREPLFAQLVTIMSDGSPQVSPVWVDTDGENVLVNTALGRVKTDNIERDRRVAVAVFDPAAPYERVVNVRGTVVEVATDGAETHIDALAKKYLGVAEYPGRANAPDDVRVILKIRVDSAFGMA